MAIIENRAKTFSLVQDFVLLGKYFLIKFSAIFLICLSLSIIYLNLNNKKLNIISELAISYVISPSVSFFDAIIDDILQLQTAVHDIFNARQENISLKLENAKLHKIIREYAALKTENQYLKSQLNIIQNYPDQGQNLVTGKIIGLSEGIFEKYAYINLGSNQEINLNNIAITDGVIVGRITQLSNYYSKITLVTDKQSRISVMTGSSGIRAIMVGDGAMGGELLYVPDISKVQIGEILYSSGEGSYYPDNYPVAKITKKYSGHIYVEPIVDLSNIKFTSILKNKE